MALRSMAAALAAVSLVGLAQAWTVDLPSCTSPFQPFVYSGCFADNSSTPALSFRSNLDSQNMTVEMCVSECKGNGYRYAGLEYYGECFCGASVNGPMLDDSQCDFPCNGNSSESCGGNSIISVWQDTTFPQAVDKTTIDDYVSVGCWTDDSSVGRALSYPQDQLNGTQMTTELCLSACKGGGFPFAGTEWSSQCWCGVVIGNFTSSANATDCQNPCNGNSSEMCGGSGRLNLYVAKDLESLQPCGESPSASCSGSHPVSTLVPPPTSWSSSVIPPNTPSSPPVVPPTTVSTPPVVPPTTVSTPPVIPPTTVSTPPVVPPTTVSTPPVVPPTTVSTPPVVPPTTESTPPVVPPTTVSTPPVIPPTTISSTPPIVPSTTESTPPVIPPTTISTISTPPVVPPTTVSTPPWIPPTTESTPPVVPPTTVSTPPVIPPTTVSTPPVVPPTTLSTPPVIPPTLSTPPVVPPTTISTVSVPPTTVSTPPWVPPTTVSTPPIVPPTTVSTPPVVPPTTVSTPPVIPPTTVSTPNVPPTTVSTPPWVPPTTVSTPPVVPPTTVSTPPIVPPTTVSTPPVVPPTTVSTPSVPPTTLSTPPVVPPTTVSTPPVVPPTTVSTPPWVPPTTLSTPPVVPPTTLSTPPVVPPTTLSTPPVIPPTTVSTTGVPPTTLSTPPVVPPITLSTPPWVPPTTLRTISTPSIPTTPIIPPTSIPSTGISSTLPVTSPFSSIPFTKPFTSTPVSSSALCTVTATVSSCEYGSGSWCSSPVPDFTDSQGCKNAFSACSLQVAACFKNAGYPGSLDCFNFASWCRNGNSYCSNAQPNGGSKPGSAPLCSKSDFIKKFPPVNGKPSTFSTTVLACAAKPTITASVAPIPTPTGICSAPANPVGGIDLPVVTCNNNQTSFAGSPFKLYTDSDSSKCPLYGRGNAGNACTDACQAQLNSCMGTYAQGCSSNSAGGNMGWAGWKRDSYFTAKADKRTFGWTATYQQASAQCQAQFNTCASQNKAVTGQGKCGAFGSGW